MNDKIFVGDRGMVTSSVAEKVKDVVGLHTSADPPPMERLLRAAKCKCIKCDQYIRACSTNVLQPAIFAAGIEGIWTSIVNILSGIRH